MHEMSIAVPLVQQLQAIVREHQADRVEAISVSAGEMRQVVPELLVSAFEMASKGTCAEDAKLEVTIVPINARCRVCGTEFGAAIDEFACPRCNQADVEIIEGNEIIIQSVSLTQSDAPSED